MNPMKLRVLARALATILPACLGQTAHAVGLGPLNLQSGLGQPLEARVQLLGPDVGTLNEKCLKSTLLTPDGDEILRPSIDLKRVDRNAAEIRLFSTANLREPAVDVRIDILCIPTLHRTYSLLLDLDDGSRRAAAFALASAATTPLDAAGDSAVAEVERAKAAAAERRNKKAADNGAARRGDEVATADDGAARGGVAGGAFLNVSETGSPGESGRGLSLPTTLRLSRTLSMPEGAQRGASSEEVKAANARFQAMLHEADATTSVPPTAVPSSGAGPAAADANAAASLPANAGSAASANMAPGNPSAGTPLAPPDPSATPSPRERARPQTTLAKSGHRSDKVPVRDPSVIILWMFGVGTLLLAILGAAAYILRRSQHSRRKADRPWWQPNSEHAAAEREAALLQKSRENMWPSKVHVGGRNSERVGEPEVVEYDNTDAALDHYLTTYGDKTADGTVPAGELRVDNTAAQPLVESAPSNRPPGLEPMEFDAIPFDLRDTKLDSPELVSDVIQEAEFWKLLNQAPRAIEILEGYCNTDAATSPAPWLYLFDLYIESAQKDKHADLSERFRNRFNLQVPGFSETGAEGRQSLEEFPELMEQVVDVWGRDEAEPFLEELLLNTRGDKREGFGLPVYREIMLLIGIAQERSRATA